MFHTNILKDNIILKDELEPVIKKLILIKNLSNESLIEDCIKYLQLFNYNLFLRTFYILKKNTKDDDKLRNIYIIEQNIFEILLKKYNRNDSIFLSDIKIIDKINNIFKLNKDKYIEKSVTITTTTCKRIDLFIRTVNSVINCILDIDKNVKEWVVIDDNSTEDDKIKMKTLFPFITFIFKNEKEKGHCKSMNMILKQVKTKYIFNIEDDWEFFIEDNYLTKMINAIENNTDIKQCLININYTEDVEISSNIWGAEYLNNGIFVHKYLTGVELEQKVKNCNYANNFYWPHFSLRPGIISTDTLIKIGIFNEDAKHFEMEYGYRYVQMGFKTAFLGGTYSIHIGRRTYERNTDIKNAYDLNKENQFGLNKFNNEKMIFLSYLINLKRREDRLIRFFKNNINEMLPTNVFEAIDGKKIDKSHLIQKTYSTGDYNYRRGIVGCASSHIELWKKFLKDYKHDFMIVIEDDAKLLPNYKEKLFYILNNFANNFEILFLHFHPYPQHLNTLSEKINNNQTPYIEHWDIQKCKMLNAGGTTGYVITKKGAYNMLEYIRKNGVTNGIDWVMLNTANENRICYSFPFLVTTQYYISSNLDTDIQNDYNSLKMEDDEWDKYEIETIIKSYNNEYKFNLINKENNNSEYLNKIYIYIKKYIKEEVKQIENNINIYINEININGISIVEKTKFNKNEIKNQVVDYYFTNKLVYIFNHIFINEYLINNKIFGENYL